MYERKKLVFKALKGLNQKNDLIFDANSDEKRSTKKTKAKKFKPIKKTSKTKRPFVTEFGTKSLASKSSEFRFSKTLGFSLGNCATALGVVPRVKKVADSKLVTDVKSKKLKLIAGNKNTA